MMNINRSLNRRSDVDRLYVPRKLGGRGLRNFDDEYIAKIPALYKHLKIESSENRYLNKVYENKNMTLNIVATSIAKQFNVDLNNDDSPKNISLKIKTAIKSHHRNQW